MGKMKPLAAVLLFGAALVFASAPASAEGEGRACLLKWRLPAEEGLLYISDDAAVPNFVVNSIGITDRKEFNGDANTQKLPDAALPRVETLLYLPGSDAEVGMSWKYDSPSGGRFGYKLDAIVEYEGAECARIVAAGIFGKRSPVFVATIYFSTKGRRIVRVEYGEKAKEERHTLTLTAPDRGEGLDGRIDKAIDAGIEYLKGTQTSAGQFKDKRKSKHFKLSDLVMTYCEHVLILYALLKSGVEPDDKCIEKGFKWAFAHPQMTTFALAATVMAIEARYTPAAEIKGSNRRDESRPFELKRRVLPRKDYDRLKLFTMQLVGAQSASCIKKTKLPDGTVGELLDFDGNCVWSNFTGFKDYRTKEKFDNLNTQLAIMALMSAQRCGVYASPKVWEKILEYFLASQEKFGPELDFARNFNPETDDKSKRKKVKARAWYWGADDIPDDPYSRELTVPTNTMIQIGAGCVHIAKSALGSKLEDKMVKAAEDSIDSGLAWLYRNYIVDVTPYNLYGLERLGSLLGMKYINGDDWYRGNAAYVVELQSKNGAWRGLSNPEKPPRLNSSDAFDTALMLLFLKRGTVPAIPTVTAD